ncbi:MAG: hypothetical protein U0836_03620 [Pirellulales bacterium]
MPRWLLLFALLSAGCTPIRHSREQQVLDHARASLGAVLLDDWSMEGHGRSLDVDGAAITPQMARAINESVLVQELLVKPETPPAVADVLALDFDRSDDFMGTGERWRRRNVPEPDWIDWAFGVHYIGTQ